VPLGLREGLGPLWPLAVAVGIVGLVAAVRRGAGASLLAGLAAAALAVDVITPYSAGGPNGPTMFPGQLRFLTLAAMLTVIAAVVVVPERWLTGAVSPVLGVGVAVVVTGLATDRTWLAVVWFGCLVVVSGGLFALTALRADRDRHGGVRSHALRWGAACASVVLLVWFSADYASHRYESNGRHGVPAAFEYFRDVRDARIAVGVMGHTYPLAGADLSNYVQMVGVVGSDGGFTPAASCAQWQRALIAGHYDYVAVGRSHSWRGQRPRQSLWTSYIRGAREVLHSGTTSVFRLPATFHQTCPFDPFGDAQ
jgi:hypothetical protein